MTNAVLCGPRFTAVALTALTFMPNGRALLLNEEGTLAVSGSSDHTLRLWDLGQQRCLQAFAVHTDSVWALAAAPDLSLVYSGGRDRCVYRWASRAMSPPSAQQHFRFRVHI